ncbi:hypothetical protein QJS04_geneDACA011161 [Acorus gramineus]|uniref:Uncharacterized protein n=1 Tax=Acorus gramineus TaxID=55184 RepID=A0AAV9BJ78_ACOGR|nr:hypothetical protein QJS04_geneDACA011161 [Acorus gramineus]
MRTGVYEHVSKKAGGAKGGVAKEKAGELKTRAGKEPSMERLVFFWVGLITKINQHKFYIRLVS